MKLLVSLLVLVPLSIVTLDDLQTDNRGAWQTLAPMPTKRQEVSTGVLNGKIYVIAGFDENGASTSVVDVYDPVMNTWSSAAPLPIATNHNAAAVAAGKLYAFGGTSNRCFTYNQPANTWSDVAAMKYQHGNTPAVAVIDDRIYVAGGDGPGMNQTEVEVYDPATNTWADLARMNVPRNHTAGAVINGKFYVAGGRPGDTAANALEVYDPKLNGWNILASMPTGRSGIGAAAINGELYVFGGEIPRIFGEVEVYNPLSNTWQQLAPMPTAKHGIFAAVIGSTVYIPGGAIMQGFGATNLNQAYSVNTAATVSAASFTPTAIAGRSIVAGFGSGLATVTAIAGTLPLPTDLGGTTVEVLDRNGLRRLAPLFFVSSPQVNYQIPPGTAEGPATIIVRGADGRVSTGAFEIKAIAPGLFTLSQNGTGAAAALDGFNFASAPFAALGPGGVPNIIAFFATGLGADATDLDANVSASVQAMVGGTPAAVRYAGRAPGFTGLNQINVALPAGIASGMHAVVIARGGIVSNSVTISIR